MLKVTISPKFQIVIPKPIREKLKLKPKQSVSILEKDGLIYIIPSKNIKNLRGYLKGMEITNLREHEDRI